MANTSIDKNLTEFFENAFDDETERTIIRLILQGFEVDKIVEYFLDSERTKEPLNTETD